MRLLLTRYVAAIQFTMNEIPILSILFNDLYECLNFNVYAVPFFLSFITVGNYCNVGLNSMASTLAVFAIKMRWECSMSYLA
jgi:hypothetical protein